MTLQEAIATFLSEKTRSLDQEYQWDARSTGLPIECNLPDGSLYKRNRDLRNLLHEWVRSSPGLAPILQVWYVRTWGGIRGNSEKTLAEYVNASDASLIEFGTRGVASWSKMLCIRDPGRYAIYDARVAMAINSIQKKYRSDEPALFPLLPSRNARIRIAQQRVVDSGYFPRRLSPSEFYRFYLNVLREALCKTSGCDLQGAEMVLFANSEALADEQWSNVGRK